MLAGGYIPMSLGRFLPPDLARQLPPAKPLTGPSSTSTPSSSASVDLNIHGVQQQDLRSILSLPYPSLHMAGLNDMLISHQVSTAVAEVFDPATAQVLVHEGSHCVPQQALHCADIRQFLCAQRDRIAPYSAGEGPTPFKTQSRGPRVRQARKDTQGTLAGASDPPGQQQQSLNHPQQQLRNPRLGQLPHQNQNEQQQRPQHNQTRHQGEPLRATQANSGAQLLQANGGKISGAAGSKGIQEQPAPAVKEACTSPADREQQLEEMEALQASARG